MPITKLTLDQLAALARPVYKQVVYVNDATLPNAVYYIQGSPDTVIINLAVWMDLADTGLLKGEAIDTASIEALQIDAGAVDTDELAVGCISADVAGRAKMDTALFDAATVLDKFVAGAIPASVLSTLALSDFATPTVAVVVASGGAGLQQIVAANATVNRVVIVQGVATVAAAGGPDIDVGSPGDPNGVFDDIGAGA